MGINNNINKDNYTDPHSHELSEYRKPNNISVRCEATTSANKEYFLTLYDEIHNETIRFLRRLEACITEQENDKSEYGVLYSRKRGALKRAALDLKQELNRI